MLAELIQRDLLDRAVFGTDWPHTNHEDEKVEDLVQWLEDRLPEGRVDAVLGNNAARLFRF